MALMTYAITVAPDKHAQFRQELLCREHENVLYVIADKVAPYQTEQNAGLKLCWLHIHHNRFVDEYVLFLDGDAASADPEMLPLNAILNGWFAGVLHQPSGALEPRKARGR
ncbi:hypothetical protein DPMN_060366 [Dreissena polymorpha]|uniref:Uncharacterized protein n=1 Tax=Dreissena polymorpha TaxID=45954 RepID=A0A9D4HHH3_DREPO|nr:hypothetical protein DPMN_060366 [Dreissena polymorpha]